MNSLGIKNSKYLFTAFSITAFFSIDANGQVSGSFLSREQLDFDSSVSFESRYDDNSLRAISGDDELGEFQNSINVGVSSTYDGQLNRLNLNYNIVGQEFSKGSRENDIVYLGAGSYVLGNEETFYGFELEHSVERLLNSPDDEFVLAETRSQKTFHVRPSLKTRNFGSNQLKVAGVYGLSDSGGDIFSKTEKYGLEIYLNRKLPSIYEVGLSMKSTDYDFENFETFDYMSNVVAANLEASSRNLSYGISLGRQKVKKDISNLSFSENVYAVNINYEAQGHELRYEDNLIISDTSFAESPLDFATGIALGGGDTQDIIEQYTRQFSWGKDTLCSTCRLTAFYSEQEVNYLTFPVENFEATNLGLNLRYEYSRYSTFTIGYFLREVLFLSDGERGSKDSSFSIRYSRSVGRKTTVGSFIERIEREEPLGDSNSIQVGIRLTIRLSE